MTPLAPHVFERPLPWPTVLEHFCETRRTRVSTEPFAQPAQTDAVFAASTAYRTICPLSVVASVTASVATSAAVFVIGSGKDVQHHRGRVGAGARPSHAAGGDRHRREIAHQIVDFTLQAIKEELIELNQLLLQNCIQGRHSHQFVDFAAPPIKEELAEASASRAHPRAHCGADSGAPCAPDQGENRGCLCFQEQHPRAQCGGERHSSLRRSRRTLQQR